MALKAAMASMETDMIIGGAILLALGLTNVFGSFVATAEIQIFFGTAIQSFGVTLSGVGISLIAYGAVSKQTV